MLFYHSFPDFLILHARSGVGYAFLAACTAHWLCSNSFLYTMQASHKADFSLLYLI